MTAVSVEPLGYGHLFPDAFADIGDALDAIVRAHQSRDGEEERA